MSCTLGVFKWSDKDYGMCLSCGEYVAMEHFSKSLVMECECDCHCNPYGGTPCQPVINNVAACCIKYYGIKVEGV